MAQGLVGARLDGHRAWSDQGSIVDLHPQTARIDLLAADALRAVARRDRAGAGVDEIVAADTGVPTQLQPSAKLTEAALLKKFYALLPAVRRILRLELLPIREIPED